MGRKVKVTISYLTIGVGNLLVYFSTLSLLHEFLEINVYLSSALAFLAVVSISFGLNRSFTFPGQATIYQFVKYAVILLMLLFANHLILYVTIEFMRWHYLVGQAIAVSILTPTNFILSYLWVFRGGKVET